MSPSRAGLTHQGLRSVAAAAAGAVLAALALLGDRVLLGGSIATGNARALLGATFGAVVTVGAFAFWMRPVAAQLASSTVPPRLVTGHLHDRFQRGIVTATVGALSYEAVVLLALPAASESPAPTVSTLLGTVIGVGAVTMLFVAMQRAAHANRPSVLVAEAAQSVMERIRRSADNEGPALEGRLQPGEGTPVRAPRSGWVQAVDVEALLDGCDHDCAVVLEVDVGTFVIADWTVVATVRSVAPSEDAAAVVGALQIGDVRATELDLAGSLSQFVDVAVHAASGASASPSTLYECFWYLGAILHELIDKEVGLPDRERSDGRTVVRGRRTTRHELVSLAVDRIRQATAGQPNMALELVRVLGDARRAAVEAGRQDVVDVLDRQGALVVEQCRQGGGLRSDIDRVVRTWCRGGEEAPWAGSRDEEYPIRSGRR